MSSADLHATLDLIENYVTDMGHTVDQDFVDELFAVEVENESVWLTGHRCHKEDQVYVVGGHPDLRFMPVVYFFSLTNDIGQFLNDEVVDNLITESDLDVDEDLPPEEEAATYLLSKLDRSEMDSLQNYLQTMITGTTHETQLYTTSSGILEGFNIGKRIFPYERDFGISEFNDAVRTVTEGGARGDRLLRRTININQLEEEPGEVDISLNFNW